ncbi:MAG: 4Fe-4S dicluster domain-containing protein [Lachnospiraceae bacterium]|nr:4Fe-4S dicluster domain-containing protein [Lachnospiraceae bacterium]
MDKILNRAEGKLLADKIAKEADVKLHECYQCGKCSAGCPMANSFDLMPRQIVHYMHLGDMDEVLRSKTIWLCASCHTCVERCPHDIDIPTLIEKSRMEAQKRGICAVRDVRLFNDIFTETIRYTGKSQEVILEGAYNVTSGHLMQDMVNVPLMLKKGIVRPEFNTVQDKQSIKKIMNKAEEGGAAL